MAHGTRARRVRRQHDTPHPRPALANHRQPNRRRLRGHGRTRAQRTRMDREDRRTRPVATHRHRWSNTPKPPATRKHLINKSRPRTRGGHPIVMAPQTKNVASSPHTRGSSVLHGSRVELGDVVPAHAGVIRSRCGLRCSAGRRPRTRGGHPASRSSAATSTASSPHTRGSSARGGRVPYQAPVVPAHAGVIPTPTGAHPHTPSRPRTRGGHPSSWSARCRGGPSSPHTRGSSPCSRPPPSCPAVVPAHAGVIRRRSPSGTTGSGRPRTRGGHPVDDHRLVGRVRSSPHTRGSSSGAGRLGPPVCVVPAHAGVIPRHRMVGPPHPGRPRTRGGHPASRSNAKHNTLSSPHTRGSSPHYEQERDEQKVVPAHAGVIPKPRRSRRNSARRPRTRGGHPVDRCELRGRVGSSPHTRGSSRCQAHTGNYVQVVPAHAGVIRPARRWSARSAGRPRTRGGHPVHCDCILVGQ